MTKYFSTNQTESATYNPCPISTSHQNPSSPMDPIQIPSPTSQSSATNGAHHPSPRPTPNNPYPTAFVQADTISFKLVVQTLTGSSETARLAARPDPDKIGPRKDRPASKLYERRSSLKISPLGPGLVNVRQALLSGSPRPEILPSILYFSSLVLSPVTPLIPDPFNRADNLDIAAEDESIQEKGFYLHPSPVRESEPRLLPLFPLTSPADS